ncbi:MAG: DUF58 domain-containing protein [Planctomycetota bacterium]
MIVPRPRLLCLVAFVALPSAILAAAVPSLSEVAALAIAALFVLSVADALLAPLAAARVRVELPELVRATRNCEAKLWLCVRRAGARALALRVALPFPREIRSEEEELAVAVPARREDLRVAWTFVPSERGSFAIDAAHVEAPSLLGFFGVRTKHAARCEIRVYPDLSNERRHAAALFLRRGSYGVRAHPRVGKGREFEKLREYVPGDSYDEIHWKASARRGRPITKVFQIERTQEVYVAIDASRLSARDVAGSAAPTTILERYVAAALVLGLAAERGGDLFGLLTFTDAVDTFLRARPGKAHYRACRDAIYALRPRAANPDFEEVCAFLRSRLRRRALVVFLTSLDDPVLAEDFVESADLIRRHHLVLVSMLRPPGAAPLFADPRVETAADVYERLAGHLRWQSLGLLEKVLRRRGVGLALVEDERLSAEVVSRYVEVKRRQAL